MFHLFYQFPIPSSLDVQIEHNFICQHWSSFCFYSRKVISFSCILILTSKRASSISFWITFRLVYVSCPDTLVVRFYIDWKESFWWFWWFWWFSGQISLLCTTLQVCLHSLFLALSCCSAVQHSQHSQSALPASRVNSGNKRFILTLLMDHLLLLLYSLWYNSVRCQAAHSTVELHCFTLTLVGHCETALQAAQTVLQLFLWHSWSTAFPDGLSLLSAPH